MSESSILHGGDRLAEVLARNGCPALFTLCGGHISPILSAARARGLRVLDVRDEATAVFAADAVGRLTGRPGVAAVTAGPGLTNTLTALKNAQLAQSPLVLLGGAAPTVLQGRGALQDIAQLPVVRPHVKWARRVRRSAELAPLLEEALVRAVEGVPGPVFLECPVDLLYPEATVRDWYLQGGGKSLSARLTRLYLRWHLYRMFRPGRPGRVEPAALPEINHSALERALGLLLQARQPLLLVGSQALANAPEAGQLAESITRMGLPCYLSGMGRGLLGPQHPLQLRQQRRLALKETDCLVLAGVPCDFRLDYGRPINSRAQIISLNRSRHDAFLNRRPQVWVEGDAAQSLKELAGKLSPRPEWQGWLQTLRQRDQLREDEIQSKAAPAQGLVNALALCQAIEEMASPQALFVADGGDFVATAAYILRPRQPLSWLDPGVFGTLGVGAGFALGSCVARPGAEIWLLLGDGASGFSLSEFDTFVRHRIPVIAVVGNDACWSQIARDQVKILNDPVGTTLARTDYHKVAEGFGASGILVQGPDEVRPALTRARALASQGQPVLINCWLASSDFREGSLSM
ncbi:thiamine pyrophosphate-binding protein [bacterium]|nr:thiamine pyrophosphate-binding protein [bacterium]